MYYVIFCGKHPDTLTIFGSCLKCDAEYLSKVGLK